MARAEIRRRQIEAQLPRCITSTSFADFGTPYRGKVRDVYRLDDERLAIVTTDRISAFDHVLRQAIPFKGQVLNQVAAHYFEATEHIAPNHLISLPHPNVTLARRASIFPVEFVVRAYLAGHAWRTYAAGGRVLCGERLPEGLRQNEGLPRPILTPSTKAVEGHDEDISRQEILARGIVDEPTLDALSEMALLLFEEGTRMAAARGLLLVDTKYEFGRTSSGELIVVDEVHTPDSSRYFYADTYEDLLRNDRPQRQLSKEFVREWLMANGFRGLEGQTLPDLPDAFRIEIAERYIELFEAVTGRAFEPDTSPNPVERIEASLKRVGESNS